MTNQKIFDKVATHLIKQNFKSMGAPGCMYRNENGLMCAVGCLITDKFYSPSIEGNSLNYSICSKPAEDVAFALLKAINNSLGEDISQDTLELLADLQMLHDNNIVEDWPTMLLDLAEAHGLSTNKLVSCIRVSK